MKTFFTAIIAGLIVFSLAGLSFGDDLKIDGSTTVLPIAQKAAEVYDEEAC